MKKTAIALLVTLGLGTAAFAFGPGGGECGSFGGPHKGDMIKKMKKLDLTSKQKEALKSLNKSRKAEFMDKREEMMKKVKTMHQEMRVDASEFMTADGFDKEAFKAQMRQKIESNIQW